jgi:hydrogenase maturation protease
VGKKILIYGYGNPGMQDDALGPVLAERIEEEGYDYIDIDANYQLNIEDAHTIGNYDIVIFADASISCNEPFELKKLEPAHEIRFSSHEMHPASVLALSRDINKGLMPQTYVLEIRGYEWEFMMEMTQQAAENLDKAVAYIKELAASDGFFGEIIPSGAGLLQ